jgi:hypothetical protein
MLASPPSGGADMGSLGVWWPVLLEKLEAILPSKGNRSRWSPSKMCMSILRELVCVADCRRNAIVF